MCIRDSVKAEDGKQSVAKYLESVSKDLKITKMIRFEVGEMCIRDRHWGWALVSD